VKEVHVMKKIQKSFSTPQYTTGTVLFTSFMAISEALDSSYLSVQLMANYIRLTLPYLQITSLKEPKPMLLYKGLKQ